VANIVDHHDRSIDQGYDKQKHFHCRSAMEKSSVVSPDGYVTVRMAVRCAVAVDKHHL
jgi:hypothetical protein